VRNVGALLLALVVVGTATAAAPPPPTLTPDVLTVGLSLPSPGFQTGAVRANGTVVAARGFEIDLARVLASRLGLERVRFVHEPSFQRLIAPGTKDWDVALAEVTITPRRGRVVDLTTPYLRADQGVLVRKGVTPPRTLAALARLRLCVQRGTTGAELVAERVLPAIPPYRFASVDLLFEAVRNGRCAAAVLDAPILAAERAGAPYRYGPMAGVIRTGERYGAVLEKGNPLTPRVNAVLEALTASATIGVLSRRWLTADLTTLPVLR
jgi:polar amino acid transport system substrate-binding protein